MTSKIYSSIVITLFYLLICTMQVNAQGSFIVRGKVILKQTGAALPGVTIIEKNRDNRIVKRCPERRKWKLFIKNCQ